MTLIDEFNHVIETPMYLNFRESVTFEHVHPGRVHNDVETILLSSTGERLELAKVGSSASNEDYFLCDGELILSCTFAPALTFLRDI